MKKFLTVFFAFTLYFNLISQANAAVGGWDLKNPVAQGASTVYDATKNVLINGKKYIKESSVKITPNPSQVAKVLARGVAGYALSVAVEQLLGSVDWVLDPANNQIKYFEIVPEVDRGGKFGCNGSIDNSMSLETVLNNCTPDNWTQVKLTDEGMKTVVNTLAGMKVGQTRTSVSVQVSVVNTNNTNPTPIVTNYLISISKVGEAEAIEEKYLPLPVVAQKVISNAEGGDVNAQVATTTAAADIVAEAEKDDAKARPIASQAEANATTKPADAAEAEKANEAQGEAKPNTANPDATDLSITFPIFCNWAPTICEAAQTVISFPQTLTNWWETGKSKAEEWATSISESWTAVKEWAKSDPPEDTELEIPEPEQPQIDTEIAFGGSCPADHQAEINMGVGVIKIPISYEPICTTVSTAKPVLIFVGFFIAALIIGGVKTE